MPKELKSSPTPARRQRASRPAAKGRNRGREADNPGGPDHPAVRALAMGASAVKRRAVKQQWFAENQPGAHASKLHQWVWARLTAPERQLSLFQPEPRSTWVDYAPGELAQAAKELVGFLKQLPEEQASVALDVLADMATDATIILSRIAKTAPQLLIPVAQKRILWPLLASSMNGLGDVPKKYTTGIPLGALAVISADLLKLKTFRADSTATRKAVELIIAIENQRAPAPYQFRQPAEWERLARELEPFSAETWPTWFGIAWLKVLDDTNGKPEDSEELHPLGIVRANREMKRHDRRADAALRYPGSEQRGIEQRLKSAFEGLSGARKKPPAPAV